MNISSYKEKEKTSNEDKDLIYIQFNANYGLKFCIAKCIIQINY